MKTAIRRLARVGGVKRISGLIYEETKKITKMGMKQESGTATVLHRIWDLLSKVFIHDQLHKANMKLMTLIISDFDPLLQDVWLGKGGKAPGKAQEGSP